VRAARAKLLATRQHLGLRGGAAGAMDAGEAINGMTQEFRGWGAGEIVSDREALWQCRGSERRVSTCEW